jgi:hypothetical protein
VDARRRRRTRRVTGEGRRRAPQSSPPTRDRAGARDVRRTDPSGVFPKLRRRRPGSAHRIERPRVVVGATHEVGPIEPPLCVRFFRSGPIEPLLCPLLHARPNKDPWRSVQRFLILLPRPAARAAVSVTGRHSITSSCIAPHGASSHSLRGAAGSPPPPPCKTRQVIVHTHALLIQSEARNVWLIRRAFPSTLFRIIGVSEVSQSCSDIEGKGHDAQPAGSGS